MKTAFIVTALAAAFAAQLAITTPAAAGSRDLIVLKPTITVSCWRGPWEEVIWDRPNAKFVDSLVNAGYDFPTAHAIAQRLCRDSTNVGKPDLMKAQMLEVLEAAPLRP